jgi:hypothetical protein
MTGSEMIDKLNRGEHVITYEMLPVQPRAPVIGEMRYVIPLLPMPGEPLASMIHGDPILIIWDGTKWI